jgi:hypothetical protein
MFIPQQPVAKVQSTDSKAYFTKKALASLLQKH